jgi:hypothetical protein
MPLAITIPKHIRNGRELIGPDQSWPCAITAVERNRFTRDFTNVLNGTRADVLSLMPG